MVAGLSERNYSKNFIKEVRCTEGDSYNTATEEAGLSDRSLNVRMPPYLSLKYSALLCLPSVLGLSHRISRL